jgi:PAS domain S-box-containing protein
VTAVVTVAVMVLTLTCGLWIWSTVRQVSADARQRDGLVRRAQLGAIVSSLQQAESGHHKYLLTGEPGFLASYSTSIERLPRVIDSARSDTTQTRRLAVLEPLVAERLALMAETIRLGDSGRARDARTLVQSGRGHQLMREVHESMAGMAEEEDSLAARWSGTVQTAARVSLITSIFAGLLAISFLILAGRALSRDFKDRARIEAERDRFFTLSLDMLCIAAGDGYFKRLNPAFTRTLGWSVEELTSRPFLDFVHPDDREATLREVERQMLRRESVLRFENRYLHKDGSWRVLSWRSAPQPDGLMFATARDVTDAQMVQAALQSAKEAADVANRAKSDFLAKMSHELRTPLNSIIGFSEILESDGVGPLNDKQKRYVANVLLSGRNLLQLINDILDLSKVEAGRMELMLEPFEVGDALAGAREMVAPLAAKKRLAMELTLLRETLPVQADQAKVKQVMFNLLSNAIKFTPEGGRIAVTARLLPAAGNGNGDRQVEIAVSDTGIGIAPEHLERIFMEFEQVGAESRQNHQGTGLGLALTRKLIELHGGRVWVESEPGKGSTFRFTLPSAPGFVSHTAEQRAAPTLVSGRPTPLVLVVDDDARSRDLISHYLEQSGYRAAGTASALDAVRLARELKPDAITLDLILPDRDGLLLLAQLKTDPETRRIPVVVVSVTERSELGFSLGAEEWLVKPVQKEAFIRALDAATRNSPSGKRTILVVDDDLTAIEYLSELVHQRGCDALCASNGRQGVELALRHLPDAIILDLAMPDMNGFEAVKALRENSRTRNTPILIVTAMDLSLAERQRLQASVQGIVSKGWQAELLTELARLCHPAEVAS